MAADEPVEIKVTISGRVEDVLAGLALDDAPVRRSLWFLDDGTPGLPRALPLLDSGLILRLRQGDDAGDSTVKLRPCRRSQLAPDWRREVGRSDDRGFVHRVEEDWAGTRRSLAASCVTDLDADLVPAALAGQVGWGSLFHPKQEEFLAQCADIRVHLGGLVALGPITAVRWKDVTVGDFLAVAERWTVDDLDFLELSIREKGGRIKALATQAAFVAALRASDVPVGDDQQTKTRTVLEHLSGAGVGPRR
jgi:hypothetical protein